MSKKVLQTNWSVLVFDTGPIPPTHCPSKAHEVLSKELSQN